MILRQHLAALVLLAVLVPVSRSNAEAPLGDALRELATQPPDPCTATGSTGGSHSETAVFTAVSALVVAALNAHGGTALERVQGVLRQAMQQARVAQAAWPENARLQGEVVAAGPAVVVTMFTGARARWFAFGQMGGTWKAVGEDEGLLDDSPRRLMRVYGLRSGRPGVARFLAARTFFGCAGSSGISYEVLEWDSQQADGYTSEVLTQEGAFGMDQAADGKAPSAANPFAPIGKLVTEGAVLKLPYCTFTGIDTWDNPSLCTLDRYDISGATIHFLSRTYNRPELVPVAKALGYAAEHDLPATRAYCASDALARQLVFEGVPGPDANVEVVQHGRGKRVWFGDHASWFDVEQRRGRWIIIGLSRN